MSDAKLRRRLAIRIPFGWLSLTSFILGIASHSISNALGQMHPRDRLLTYPHWFPEDGLLLGLDAEELFAASSILLMALSFLIVLAWMVVERRRKRSEASPT